MIQPLKNDPSVWSLCWVDLPEPLPVENDFFLPTVLLLVGPRFEPLVAPEIVDDLPGGGRRLDQRASGYRYMLVSGEIVTRGDKPTGVLPGRLVRGRQPAPAPARAA